MAGIYSRISAFVRSPRTRNDQDDDSKAHIVRSAPATLRKLDAKAHNDAPQPFKRRVDPQTSVPVSDEPETHSGNSTERSDVSISSEHTDATTLPPDSADRQPFVLDSPHSLDNKQSLPPPAAAAPDPGAGNPTFEEIAIHEHNETHDITAYDHANADDPFNNGDVDEEALILSDRVDIDLNDNDDMLVDAKDDVGAWGGHGRAAQAAPPAPASGAPRGRDPSAHDVSSVTQQRLTRTHYQLDTLQNMVLKSSVIWYTKNRGKRNTQNRRDFDMLDSQLPYDDGDRDYFLAPQSLSIAAFQEQVHRVIQVAQDHCHPAFASAFTQFMGFILNMAQRSAQHTAVVRLSWGCIYSNPLHQMWLVRGVMAQHSLDQMQQGNSWLRNTTISLAHNNLNDAVHYFKLCV